MYLKTLSILLLLTTGSNAFSLESDANAEITIQSNSAEFDRKAGTATYIGDVILEQGTLLINADTITLHSDQNQQLEKAIAIGAPAHFQQQMEGDKGLTKAQGHSITYLTQDKTVVLLKNAVVEQAGNSFSGDSINYNIISEKISAKGQQETSTSPTDDQSQSTGRIKMIIQPAQSAEKTNNEDA